MVDNAYPSPEDDPISYRTASGNSCLTTDDRLRPNRGVVPDLYKVVDFRNVADAGSPERAPVNTAICTDINVSADGDGPDLRDWNESLIGDNHVPKPI
jgi:hypothetical protein